MHFYTFCILALMELVNSSRPIEVPIFKHIMHNIEANSTQTVGKSKRQNVVATNAFDVLTWTYGGGYYVNITVGTPPQDQTVLLDTGSSDLYFDCSEAATCQTSGSHACRGGTFDQRKSSTYGLIESSPAFGNQYADGSSVSGSFGHDTIGIGNLALPNVQFGVAESSNSTTGYSIGLMGLGYSVSEVVAKPYPNIPEVLVNAGVTNSRLYSIFLNTEDKISGTILFGGIDTSKYTGKLATLDLLPPESSSMIDSFITVVTGAAATINGQTTTFFQNGSAGMDAYLPGSPSLPVLLDTGSAAWTVPPAFYTDHIAPAFPFVDGNGQCSCQHRSTNTSLALELGGRINIRVPARELLVPLYNASTRAPLPYLDGPDPACQLLILGAEPAAGTMHTLGDAVLRSMYVVYDLDNGQVGVAQAADVDAGVAPRIVPVPAGRSGVSRAVGGGGVLTAGPNFATVASAEGPVPTTFLVSTRASAIGTATGAAAVPTEAWIEPGSVFGGPGTRGSRRWKCILKVLGVCVI